MATPIRIKRSAVAGKKPTTSDLQLGELAVNFNDGKVFLKQDTSGVGVGTRIVEVGAGPRGSILNTKGNFKRGIVVEPLIDRWPPEIRKDYEDIGVEIIDAPYEDLDIEEKVDETWFFNVVQHVFDPKEQLELAKSSSKIVRVFESIGSVTDVAHPHFITPETFTDVLGNFGKIYKGGSEPGFHGADCYYGTWNESDNV